MHGQTDIKHTILLSTYCYLGLAAYFRQSVVRICQSNFKLLSQL